MTKPWSIESQTQILEEYAAMCQLAGIHPVVFSERVQLTDLYIACGVAARGDGGKAARELFTRLHGSGPLDERGGPL